MQGPRALPGGLRRAMMRGSCRRHCLLVVVLALLLATSRAVRRVAYRGQQGLTIFPHDRLCVGFAFVVYLETGVNRSVWILCRREGRGSHSFLRVVEKDKRTQNPQNRTPKRSSSRTLVLLPSRVVHTLPARTNVWEYAHDRRGRQRLAVKPPAERRGTTRLL